MKSPGHPFSRIIWQSGVYRITEYLDFHTIIDDLKGDCFNPAVNIDIALDKLKIEEREFENLVRERGVFGYVLNKWNPEVNHGWSHVDSCWGFVGEYDAKSDMFNHYIIEEMKRFVR